MKWNSLKNKHVLLSQQAKTINESFFCIFSKINCILRNLKTLYLIRKNERSKDNVSSQVSKFAESLIYIFSAFFPAAFLAQHFFNKSVIFKMFTKYNWNLQVFSINNKHCISCFAQGKHEKKSCPAISTRTMVTIVIFTDKCVFKILLWLTSTSTCLEKQPHKCVKTFSHIYKFLFSLLSIYNENTARGFS